MPEAPPILHRVHDYLAYQAGVRGDQAAVVCTGRTLTYGELWSRVRACAASLIGAGLQPGDRVATLSPMQLEYWITFLATSMAGGVWLGLNPRLRRQELHHIVTDGRPRFLFAVTRTGDRDLVADIRDLAERGGIERVIGLNGDGDGIEGFASFLSDGCSARDLEWRTPVPSGRDPVLLVYTSGSTGSPKGALLTHEGLIARALNQVRAWPTEPIRVVNVLPIDHIGGVGFISLYSLVGGGTQFLESRFDAGRFVEQLVADRITIWIGVPTVFLMVLAHPKFDPARLPDLQWAVWSGAALPVSAIRRLREIGCGLTLSYGLTESSGSVCYAPPGLDDETLSRTIGRPVPDGEVRLAGSDGLPVAPGQPGEIQLRSEWAMAGYLGREDATREARTHDGFVRTGDLGRMDENGCIELIGRIRDMYKSGGHNVYPREVEIAIEEHPAVAACAIVPISDPLFQEVGFAFVQAVPGHEVDLAGLRDWCAGRLANFKIPKRFKAMSELPLLGVGKIDRQTLRALASAEIASKEEAASHRPELTRSAG